MPQSPPGFEEMNLLVKIIDHHKIVEPTPLTPQSDIHKKIEAAERAVKFSDHEEAILTNDNEYLLGSPNEEKKHLKKKSISEMNIHDGIIKIQNTSFQPNNEFNMFTS